jgi:hypothetical protein
MPALALLFSWICCITDTLVSSAIDMLHCSVNLKATSGAMAGLPGSAQAPATGSSMAQYPWRAVLSLR